MTDPFDQHRSAPLDAHARAQLLHGWGCTQPSLGRLHRPGSVDEIATVIAGRGGDGCVPRGRGRGYGDCATLAGGDVVIPSGRAVRIDGTSVTCDAGVTLDDLINVTVPLGMFPPVTPGTSRVSIGGMVAADVHGKNHHCDGSFGNWVRQIELVTGTGERVTFDPEHTPDEFRATIGGMGLTGVITRVTFELHPIPSSSLLVTSERTADFDATVAALARHDRDHRYSVAWVDLTARRGSCGRGVLTGGDWLAGGQAWKPLGAARLRIPRRMPGALVNRHSVRMFNDLWWRQAPAVPETHHETVRAFFHPLDGVDDWNRLYGRDGFVQHQFVLPDGQEDELARIAGELGATGAACLTVLKRFGPGNANLLSFPTAGWTLAVDLPARFEQLAVTLDRIDERVAAAGGRVYLAKDARLHPRHLPVMYPHLGTFRDICDRLDPQQRIRSDLDMRLGLRAAARAGMACHETRTVTAMVTADGDGRG